MMQNEQEWVKNITPTGMKVKVKRLGPRRGHWTSGSMQVKAGFCSLQFFFLILSVAGVGAAGCNRDHSLGSISNDRLITIYVDLLDARKMPISRGADSAATADSVLMKHGVSRQEFLDAVHARSINPEGWKTFYEEVARKLEERQNGKAGEIDSLRTTIGVRPEPSSK